MRELLEHTFEFADQRTLVRRRWALFLVLDLVVQDEPNNLGDAVGHGPSGAFAIDARFQSGKQTSKEAVLSVDRGPGDLTQQTP